MNFWIYKLEFCSELHIGNGLLADSNYTMFADTFFSALCIEALKLYGQRGIDQLQKLVIEDELILSDGFPYKGEMLYFPKPVNYSNVSSKYGSSAERKLWKKIRYLPVNALFGSEDINIQEEYKKIKELGKSRIRIDVSIHGLDKPEPYGVGGYQFYNNNGMYFIIGIRQQYEEMFDYLMDLLQYTGIGGKVSSGMGRFGYQKALIDDSLQKRICYGKQAVNESNLMTLSISLPDEIPSGLYENSSYVIIKRSGFVASENYSQNQREVNGFAKKKVLYAIQSGSCMSQGYCGSTRNVADGGTHEVLKYVKPLFWRLNDE